MKITATNIRYDTDGKDVDLPTTLTLEVDDTWFADDPDDCVCQAISDKTGWCVLGFDLP
jgi:hypothetical protein